MKASPSPKTINRVKGTLHPHVERFARGGAVSGVVALGLVLCGGCSVYDEGLLDVGPARTQTFAMSAGAAAAIAPMARAGQFGGAVAGAGAASVPVPGYSSTLCGDGLLSAGELCDIAIPSGMPGACPSACASTDACWKAILGGRGCETSCILIAAACGAKDGCCAAQCNPGSDADCSGSCGDGVVDAARGELCETGPYAAASQRCPVAQDCVDTNPCSEDAISGSASNCNATCMHTPIATSRSGDSCCPAGANANTDSDCLPRCGNGVREGSEACDGTSGCDPGCNLTVTSAQRVCLAANSGYGCSECECTHCTEQLFACGNSGDVEFDRTCTSVEACAVQHHCVGRACYCGIALTDLDCALFGNGPCRDVIERAAGSTNPYVVTALTIDPTSSLGRAQTLGYCRSIHCARECL
jgi:hypothetical protein